MSDRKVINIAVIRTSNPKDKYEPETVDKKFKYNQFLDDDMSPYFAPFIFSGKREDLLTYHSKTLFEKEKDHEIKVNFCCIEDFPDVILILKPRNDTDALKECITNVLIDLENRPSSKWKNKTVDTVRFYIKDSTNFHREYLLKSIISDFVGNPTVRIDLKR